MLNAADDENHPETEIANVRIHPDILLRAVDELNCPDLAEEEITASVARTLARAAEVFGVTGVGLMLTDPADQTLRYVAATDALAERLEAAQEESGEGPCVEAFVLNRTVATPDVRVDPRWPTLQRMPNLGDVAAVLGVPTRLGSEPIGSLNAYSNEPRIWDESEIAAIVAFNELLESRLAAATWARSHDRASVLCEQLQHALDQRVPIERGVGYIMGRYGIGAVAAFQLIRNCARRRRLKVADVTAEILDGVEFEEITRGISALGGESETM